MESEQRLSRAAKLQHLVEHQRDRLLHAPVWILLIAVACLHEAHRRADDKLAPSRLLVTGRERTLAQEIEFVLVEAAPSIRAGAGHCRDAAQRPSPDRSARIDHAAHLDQLQQSRLLRAQREMPLRSRLLFV